MQPHQHRDFMYTAQKEFPETEFTPVSTHTTREVKVSQVRGYSLCKNSPETEFKVESYCI